LRSEEKEGVLRYDKTIKGREDVCASASCRVENPRLWPIADD
jgi:hypothetical protein